MVQALAATGPFVDWDLNTVANVSTAIAVIAALGFHVERFRLACGERVQLVVTRTA